MSAPQYEIVTHLQVYDNQVGHYLTVCPSPDFPDEFVLLHTEASQQEFWGPVRLELPKGMATALAHALLKVVEALPKP